MSNIENILIKNFEYIKEQGYMGYDPKIYDYMPMTSKASFSPIFARKVLRRIEVEIFRRRFPKLLIPYLKLNRIDAQTIIPYGLGVFIQSFVQMYKIYNKNIFLVEAEKVAKELSHMLIQLKDGLGVPNPSKGKKFKYGNGIFDDNTAYLPGGSEVFFGLYELYEVTKEHSYFNICEQIAKGFMTSFHQKNISKGKLALDYSNTGDNSHVLNANALAMACLSIMYKETKKDIYKDIAIKIFNYINPYMKYENIPYSGIEDKIRDKSWYGCDTYHTGFTLRSMYITAKIFGFETEIILDKIKEMMNDFVVNDKIIVYKTTGQRGELQDAHAVAEYIRVFASFFDHFSELEQKKHLDVIMKNLKSFIYKKSYYYTVNRNKKFYLYMPRWSHGPMMNALSLLDEKIMKVNYEYNF